MAESKEPSMHNVIATSKGTNFKKLKKWKKETFKVCKVGKEKISSFFVSIVVNCHSLEKSLTKNVSAVYFKFGKTLSNLR